MTVWNQENITLVKNTASSIANALAKDREIIALRKLNIEQLKVISRMGVISALKNGEITTGKAAILLKGIEADTTEMLTLKEEGLTLAEIALKKAKEGLTLAFTEFLVPIAAVAAAIGALYLAFEGLKTL
jgi:hypothetical protein